MIKELLLLLLRAAKFHGAECRRNHMKQVVSRCPQVHHRPISISFLSRPGPSRVRAAQGRRRFGPPFRLPGNPV